ncbi:hypothetical protein EYC84_002599 [Monilinia fructicola]|uniref:Uncharacterized protein n=1 Tax=Monilinia fructicola TaxID=38448 RepID=A0A5M9JR76_MONFR|nr:hypothetical protein EYC84_002599 [Monilinia fructicola]
MIFGILFFRASLVYTLAEHFVLLGEISAFFRFQQARYRRITLTTLLHMHLDFPPEFGKTLAFRTRFARG